jgi:hypothetical protein
MNLVKRVAVKNSADSRKWFFGKRWSCNLEAAGHYSPLKRQGVL